MIAFTTTPGARPTNRLSLAAPHPPRTLARLRGRRILWVGQVLLAWMLGLGPVGAAEPGDGTGGVPLTLNPSTAHHLDVTVLGEGATELKTTGSDPYLFTMPLPAGADVRRNRVLAFESFSTTGTDHLQVFLVPGTTEARSLKVEGILTSEGWTSRGIDLTPLFERTGWQAGGFRLDFGTASKRTVRIRNLQLRPPTEQELALETRREAVRQRDRELDARLRAYLTRRFDGRVESVEVGRSNVTIRGTAPAGREVLQLVEIPFHADAPNPRAALSAMALQAEPSGRFTLVVDRWARDPAGTRHDRLFSRWALARQGEGGLELTSHARYADRVEPEQTPAEERPKNRKGLGALGLDRPLSDLEDLGVSAVTVNVHLGGLIRMVGGPGRLAFESGGRGWFADEGYVNHLDAVLREAARRSLVVSAIVLLPQATGYADREYGRRVAHPDADPSGIFVMPNLTTAEGVQAYAAAMEFLARRYSRPDKQFGRIHHWILHNEVNSGWVWTNAGDKSSLAYMDLYHRSMRLVHLIARQVDPHAKTFISLEHHWTVKYNPHCYEGRTVLEHLVEYCRAGGDFEWALAFHPYPQSLFEPRVWEDTEATPSFDTPKITFHNVEVLDAWMRQPALLHQGKPRTIHLSEQGLNSKDYGPKALRDQAAGMAYTWNKLRHLETIEMFHYHNWVDNRGEGGLRIGLRRFPDDSEFPLGRKPIWEVFRALDTPGEEAATAFALEVIGIPNWEAVRQPAPVSPPAPRTSPGPQRKVQP